MDEDEHKLQLGDTRMGPFGVVVKDKWIPLYLRTPRPALKRLKLEKLGVKNIDLYNYDPLYATDYQNF